jgi:hypothetical protein
LDFLAREPLLAEGLTLSKRPVGAGHMVRDRDPLGLPEMAAVHEKLVLMLCVFE